MTRSYLLAEDVDFFPKSASIFTKAVAANDGMVATQTQMKKFK